jgi:anti-sigma regulatory factor (Ser/Thr protein kinase)
VPGSRVQRKPGEHASNDDAALLVVRNHLAELPRVTAWVHGWVQQHGLPARTAERLDLCATEVVTNIVMHGYAGGASAEISLQLICQDECVTLAIEDDGIPFDPRQVPEPSPAASLEDAAVGGRGIQLVRRFSDQWQYSRLDGRNRSTLVIRLSPPCRSGSSSPQAAH